MALGEGRPSWLLWSPAQTAEPGATVPASHPKVPFLLSSERAWAVRPSLPGHMSTGQGGMIQIAHSDP